MQQNNFNSIKKTAKIAVLQLFTMLFVGSISMVFISCEEEKEEIEVINIPEQAVDLGLPSGTLWAKYNVGATKPEEFGDYFAWGETTGLKNGKTNFSWDTYKWCNGSDKKLTKYCNDSNYGNDGFADGKTELDLADDAAYANWGSNWRMPNYNQVKELIDNCNWEWTTLNGVRGSKATSKKNGNSIFLPAAGGYSRIGLENANTDGCYWSMSLYTDEPKFAQGLNISSDGGGGLQGARLFGFCIRPVYVKK